VTTIKDIEANAERARQSLREAEQTLEAASAVAAQFPDATLTWIRNGERWASKNAHEVADRVDPIALAACGWGPIFSYVLYKTIATNRGEARVYSPLHVDVREGYRLHFEEGIPLVDALRSTTAAAEQKCAHKEAASKANEEKKQQMKKAEEAAAAQPRRDDPYS